MRKWVPVLLAGFVLTLPGAGRAADDQGDAKQIITRAIKAMGGEDNLAKFKAATYKGKGTFHGMGLNAPFSFENAVQLPSKTRSVVTAAGFNITIVFNGDKGWIDMGGNFTDMNEAQAVEQKESLYAATVSTLVPLLREKGFTLTGLGESKVGDQAAEGVKISHKGHRDISLFFDKKTNLLIRSERKIKDEMGTEMTEEGLYSSFKKVDGIQEAMKLTVNRDGKPYVEEEIEELKHTESLPDSTFEKGK
jgi:hypothetical protein